MTRTTTARQHGTSTVYDSDESVSGTRKTFAIRKAKNGEYSVIHVPTGHRFPVEFFGPQARSRAHVWVQTCIWSALDGKARNDLEGALSPTHVVLLIRTAFRIAKQSPLIDGLGVHNRRRGPRSEVQK